MLLIAGQVVSFSGWWWEWVYSLWFRSTVVVKWLIVSEFLVMFCWTFVCLFVLMVCLGIGCFRRVLDVYFRMSILITL